MSYTRWLLTPLIGLALLMPATTAWSVATLKVKSVAVVTAENLDPHGNSLRITFNQTVRGTANADPRIQTTPDVPTAPAGYASDIPKAQLAARNYRIIIIPEPGSRTSAFDGTWAALGGRAVYDMDDPNGKTVLLLLQDRNRPVFFPGDQIKIQIAPTLETPNGETYDTDPQEQPPPLRAS